MSRNMEHMRMRWRVQVGDASWLVLTDEPTPWYVCRVFTSFAGDPTGIRTARAICRAHNTGLRKGRRVQP